MFDHNGQLNDPRWKVFKETFMNRSDGTCQICHKRSRNLDIHHKLYIEGKNLWDYPDRLLQVLCGDCHDRWHLEHKYLTVKESELHKHMVTCPYCARERELKGYIYCKYCDGTGKIYKRDFTDY